MTEKTTTGQRRANILLSRRLSIWLALGYLLLVGVVGATSYWMAREHDRLAAEGTRQMVNGGFHALEKRLETLILDYSHWTEAYDAVLARDLEWLYPNSGSSTNGSGALDLIIVIEPGGVSNFGWSEPTGDEARSDLLDAATMTMVDEMIDGEPHDWMRTYTTYAVSNNELWLLTSAWITLSNDFPEGATQATLPRHLFGLRVTDELIAGVGAQIFLDDISLSEHPAPGRDNFALTTARGEEVGYVSWVPPRPGIRIIKRVAMPLIIVLLLCGVGTVIASRTMVASAMRLERALEAARAADIAKSEFLANVSHELRTPMNGVMGVAGLIKKTELDPKQAEMINIIVASARSQLLIIDDLLDIAQIEAGTATLDSAPFDPAMALNDVVGLLRPEADKKDLQFVVDAMAGGADHVLGDRQAFKQIATNLIGNAIKFTDTGMVTVRFEISAQPDRAVVTLVVSDTGRGVAAEHHKLIFERFVQVDGSKRRTARGSGLGLAITKSLVDRMGGTIGLESQPGEGATFTVDLEFGWAAGPGRQAAA